MKKQFGNFLLTCNKRKIVIFAYLFYQLTQQRCVRQDGHSKDDGAKNV